MEKQLLKNGSSGNVKTGKQELANNDGGGSRSRTSSRSGSKTRDGSTASNSSRKTNVAQTTETARKQKREQELDLRRMLNKAAIARSQSETLLTGYSDSEFGDEQQYPYEEIQSDAEFADEDVDMPMATRVPPVRSLRKRKRGRPPTTGEYVDLAAKKKAFIDLRKQEQELERHEKLKSMTSAELYASMKIDLEEAIEDLRENPTADISSRARESLDDVFRVVKKSKNLQGICPKVLKQAAVLSSAAIEVLKLRADSKMDPDTARQLRSLKKELEQAKRENKETKKKMDQLRKEPEELKASNTQRGRRVAVIRDSPTPEPPCEKGTEEVLSPKGDDYMDTLPWSHPDDGSQTDERMEVEVQQEAETKTKKAEKKEKVTLSPRDQWPLAIRPPIKGVAKIIEDRPLEGIKIKIMDGKRKDVVNQNGQTNPLPQAEGIQAIMSQLAPVLENWLQSSITALGLGLETKTQLPRIAQATQRTESAMGQRDPLSTTVGKKMKKKGAKDALRTAPGPFNSEREVSPLPRLTSGGATTPEE